MEGTQKRKATGLEPSGDKKEWEEYFTYDGTGRGTGRFEMQPWKPCPLFRGGTSPYNWTDPQPRMRMSIGLAKMKGIVKALNAMLHEMQPSKKTRSGAAFALGQPGEDDKAPKQLRIHGGWADWQADYDHNGAAVAEYRIKEALHWQEQLGATIGLCGELESLSLRHMQWYAHKDKKGVKLFFVNLRSCEKLKKLSVVNNTCGGCFLDVIIPEVVQMPLRVLDLSGNRLYREDMYPEEGEIEARERAFVEVLGTLGECKTLESLGLADMNLEFKTKKGCEQAMQCVLRLMQELPLLKALKLSENQMTPQAKAKLEKAKPVMLEIAF